MYNFFEKLMCIILLGVAILFIYIAIISFPLLIKDNERINKRKANCLKRDGIIVYQLRASDLCIVDGKIVDAF